MKSATSAVAQDTKKAVHEKFSHFYKAMGERTPSKSGNVLAMMQRGTKETPPVKKK